MGMCIKGMGITISPHPSPLPKGEGVLEETVPPTRRDFVLNPLLPQWASRLPSTG
jgi:hypothetical protein